jgi:hypothetical protein
MNIINIKEINSIIYHILQHRVHQQVVWKGWIYNANNAKVQVTKIWF